MMVRLSDEPDGRVCVQFPYDPDFIRVFKDTVSYGERSWEPARKSWLLTSFGVEDLMTLCATHSVQVNDQRQMVPTGDPYASMPTELRTSFACLYLAPAAPLCVAEASHKALAKVFHPDMPDGDTAIMERINDAIACIRQYFTTDEDSIPF